jgi:Mg-chelatase subunit ChlD
VSRFGRLINAGFGRCKHRVLGTCVDAADGCCAGVACALCVKLLDGYGEVVDGVSLAWNGTGYSGSVGGFSFESYWLDNYGACEFHVIISAGGYIEPIHIIKTKGDYTDAACCMNPGGETEVDDGTDTYTMTWGPVDPLILARRPVTTSECAQIDIALVVDDTSSMASVISSLQTEIGNLVTAVDAISDSFQFSLITFKDTTTQTVSFSINNAAAINAAVAAMTTGMGNQIPEASDIALNEAVVQSGWRAAAQKVIVLITDAPPGGLDDVADPADVINLNAGGTAAGVADQYMYCVGVGTNAAMISAMSSTAAAAVAAGGSGKYETLTPGNIVTNVIALVDTLCPPVTCYERFCGDCDCAPRKLCLQVVSDDCSVAKIISLAENYADPDCPLPVWDLDFTCGTFSFSGQLALVRDEYTGGCILQMSGTRGGAVDEESHDFAITDCAALSATYLLTEDYVDYLITISPADCDACNPPKHQTACCIAPLPPVLYGKLINDVNAGCMEAAGIITLNWTAEDPTPSNQFGFGNGGGWIGSAALPCVQAGVVCVKFWCQLVTSTGKPTNDDCLSFAAQVDTGCGPTTPVCLTLSGGTINGNAGPTATDGCDCTDPDEEVEMLYVRFTIALSDPGCTQNPINGFHLEVAENPLDLP